jgi:hypothetical protein
MFTRNDFLLKIAGAAAHDNMNCLFVGLCSHGLDSGAQNSFECIAVPPDKKQFKNGDKDCGRDTFGSHQNMEDPNVYDNRAKNRQAQGNKATDQQQQTSDHLKPADDINVAALKECVQVFAGYALRKRRHRKEMQECVGAEYNKD